MGVRAREMFVYILASRSRRLYVGVSNDLVRRVWQHRSGAVPGFTKRYGINRLVYFEAQVGPLQAIQREKQIKDYARVKARDDRFNQSRLERSGWVLVCRR